MAATDINKELATYLPLLTERQQGILLDMVKNILHIDKKEKHITIDQYNKEIDQALKQINNGETSSHAEMLKQSTKWFKRK